MSEPTPESLNSGIQLARNFDGEKMRRERELLKQLIESKELLAKMKQEYANFLKQNPEIAIDINEYFESKKLLSQTEQNLEEDLEGLKNENKSPEEIEKQKESEDFEKLVIQIPKDKAMDLQVKRKELLQKFKPENYQKEGLTMEQTDEIKSEFNTLWGNACESGDFVVVENFMELIKDFGLKIGFEKYKSLNKGEIIQRQIAQNNWEAFFIADFLKLFDEFILPKGANRNMWLKWVQTQETHNSHQKQADLSEQINEQKIANQQVAEQNKVENFRQSLVKMEQKIANPELKSQELTFQDIPKSWDELGERFDKIPGKYFTQFGSNKNKIEIWKVRSVSFCMCVDNIEYGCNFPCPRINFIPEYKPNGKDFVSYNKRCLYKITRDPEYKHVEFEDLSAAYLELREFFVKFGLEF